MLKTPPELLLSQGPLRIRYLHGESRTLVVSYSGVGNTRSEEPSLEFVETASDGGKNHVLFVTDQSRSWLNGPGVSSTLQAAVTAVRTETRADRVLGLGNSMGGSMAILLADEIPFDAVLAFTPQYSILSSEVPEETRWTYFRKRIASFPYPRVDTFRTERTKYFMLHGDDDSELAHALRFPIRPGISHRIVPNCGHTLARQLKRKGVLSPIVRDFIDGRYRRMRSRLDGIQAVTRARLDLEARGGGSDHRYAAE